VTPKNVLSEFERIPIRSHGAKDQALKFPAFVNRFKKFPSKVISEGESHVFRWSVA
jgi:hypothetical protein